MSDAPRFLTRDELLSPPALDERVVELDGFGNVLVGELSGEQRAKIFAEQAQDAQANDGRIDFTAFQRKLLAAGILDPDSPKEARVPLLKSADVAVLMKKLGGSKIDRIIAAVQEMSGMSAPAGQSATEVMKGNSDATESGSTGSD